MEYIYIYGLVDPTNNLIKYVGATNDLGMRYQSHLDSFDSTKRAEWIKSLLAKNLKPYLTLLEKVTVERAAESESKWAECYKANELYNFFPITPYCQKESKSKIISIRIGNYELSKLKQLSSILGIKYQTLIKNWIKEKI